METAIPDVPGWTRGPFSAAGSLGSGSSGGADGAQALDHVHLRREFFEGTKSLLLPVAVADGYGRAFGQDRQGFELFRIQNLIRIPHDRNNKPEAITSTGIYH